MADVRRNDDEGQYEIWIDGGEGRASPSSGSGPTACSSSPTRRSTRTTGAKASPASSSAAALDDVRPPGRDDRRPVPGRGRLHRRPPRVRRPPGRRLISPEELLDPLSGGPGYRPRQGIGGRRAVRQERAPGGHGRHSDHPGLAAAAGRQRRPGAGADGRHRGLRGAVGAVRARGPGLGPLPHPLGARGRRHRGRGLRQGAAGHPGRGRPDRVLPALPDDGRAPHGVAPVRGPAGHRWPTTSRTTGGGARPRRGATTRAWPARRCGAFTPRWQTVLWHTEIEGRSSAEVGDLLGLSPNAAAALIGRARDGLRRAYAWSSWRPRHRSAVAGRP